MPKQLTQAGLNNTCFSKAYGKIWNVSDTFAYVCSVRNKKEKAFFGTHNKISQVSEQLLITWISASWRKWPSTGHRDLGAEF